MDVFRRKRKPQVTSGLKAEATSETTVTEETAAKIANVLLGAAAIGVAIYVIKTPPLRRMAWRVALTTLTGTAPVWFRAELQRAWAESGRAHPAGPALT